MLGNLEKIIFPPTCAVTGKETTKIDLSIDIIKKLQPAEGICPVCAGYSITNKVCGGCIISPPIISATQVGYLLNDELKVMIHQYKYGKNLFYSRLFVEIINFEVNGVEALVPVPLHINRLSNRGFNQSLELAKFLSKKYQLPIIEAVSRIKDTAQQTSLTEKQRKKNLKGAFAVDKTMLAGIKSIAIIDDVITTNSTINEIAKAINKTINRQINMQAWAIAKTPK